MWKSELLTCGQSDKELILPYLQIAIKFDPFMYLSLAIPQNKKWIGDIHVVPLDPHKPEIRVSLEIPVNTTARKLKQVVGDLTGYDPKRVSFRERLRGQQTGFLANAVILLAVHDGRV